MAEKDFTGIEQNETPEKDINDVFDNIAFSEDLISNEAFQEGLIKGKNDGKLEGYHLGFHKGFDLGVEIGFYRGLTKVLINDLPKNDKTQSTLQKLIDSLEGFSEQNDHDSDIVKKLNDIRANFKKLNSLLKLNISIQETSAISF